MRGYFVRGSGTNADGTKSDGFGEKQDDAFQGHKHITDKTSISVSGGSWGKESKAESGNGSETMFDVSPTVTITVDVGNPSTDKVNGTPRTASETRPKNIALLYCIKI
jgi:hypothetical protein